MLLDLCYVLSRTAENAAYLKRCQSAIDDTDRAKRLEAGVCKVCWYLRQQIGGARTTAWNCGRCNAEEVAGSTAHDKICRPCAAKWKVCRRCAGDLGDKQRRKLE